MSTTVEATVDRVVDGDTIRVFLDGTTESESLRILALDTEEVSPGSKPVTKLGRAASERAKQLFSSGDRVRLTLPGDEPLDVALRKHRGNFGRLLVYVDLADDRDFQELMIREGLSPYFVKYGYAHHSARHAAYIAAERDAQAANLGIWNQIENNGAIMRNYAALGVWWDQRGRIIEEYRELKRQQPDVAVYNTRLDYAQLREIAEREETATVFMELRSFSPAGADHIVFQTGSLAQPFSLFVPDGNTPDGADVMQLLITRYVSESEEMPRRSYAYITGPTNIFRDTPQIVVTSPNQITDLPAQAAERADS